MALGVANVTCTGGRSSEGGPPPTGGRAGADGTGVSGGASSGGSAGTDAGAGDDAGCYRNPYLPDKYKPPCGQPKAKPDCSGGWCTIEPGCFIMGSPWCEWGRAKYSEDPGEVTLTHRFRIQQLELTQAEWTAAGVPNPSGLMTNGTGDCSKPDCPVGNMTFSEALAYTNLVSKQHGLPACYVLSGCTGQLGKGMTCKAARTAGSSVYDCPGFRLPTGAEWEYAARAGTRTSVYTGEIVQRSPSETLYTCADDPVLSPIAWYCANAGRFTHPGGQKHPNGWGLYDMIGNAAEWVGSAIVPHGYVDGPYVDWGAQFDLQNLGQQGIQVRGGLFNIWPSSLRAAEIIVSSAGLGSPGLGFRMVQTVQ